MKLSQFCKLHKICPGSRDPWPHYRLPHLHQPQGGAGLHWGRPTHQGLRQDRLSGLVSQMKTRWFGPVRVDVVHFSLF